jgi:hypothetical protein
MKIIAKKFIEKKIEKDCETIKNEIRYVDLDFDKLIDFCEIVISCFDDPESSYYSYGIAIDWDDNIFSIDVDTFTEQIKEELKENIEEFGDYYLSTAKDIITKLHFLEGFTLYLTELKNGQ